MLEMLITGEIPENLKIKVGNSKNWDVLSELWSRTNVETLKFTNKDLKWSIEESLGGSIFNMERDVLSGNRNTIMDEFGLLGVTLLDLKQDSVILTEGVSDYFSVKLLCPNRDVLGVTTLGGSKVAKAILVNLFNSFTICADNDSTGLKNASNWKKFLEGYGKQVNIFTPPIGKDITDTFIFNLKLNQ